jgi:hypothetical protein
MGECRRKKYTVLLISRRDFAQRMQMTHLNASPKNHPASVEARRPYVDFRL